MKQKRVELSTLYNSFSQKLLKSSDAAFKDDIGGLFVAIKVQGILPTFKISDCRCANVCFAATWDVSQYFALCVTESVSLCYDCMQSFYLFHFQFSDKQV